MLRHKKEHLKLRQTKGAHILTFSHIEPYLSKQRIYKYRDRYGGRNPQHLQEIAHDLISYVLVRVVIDQDKRQNLVNLGCLLTPFKRELIQQRKEKVDTHDPLMHFSTTPCVVLKRLEDLILVF
jgi:hypothetical protein